MGKKGRRKLRKRKGKEENGQEERRRIWKKE